MSNISAYAPLSSFVNKTYGEKDSKHLYTVSWAENKEIYIPNLGKVVAAFKTGNDTGSETLVKFKNYAYKAIVV